MEDDIEVNVSADKKDETPVSFVESDNETLVHIGSPEKSNESKPEDERLRAAEQEQARLSRTVIELQSRLAGNNGNQPSSGGPSGDPYKASLDAITQRERALGIQWEAHKAARSLTPQLLEQFDNESRELQQQRMDVSAQRAMAAMAPRIAEHTQQQQFRTEYADVWNNQNANRWARGHYDQLVASGAPETPDTVRAAMNAARVQFRMPGARSAPTDHDRQQFTGFSGQRRTSVDSKNNVVKMGKSEKIMAMAMYGDRNNGDEQKSYAQWAKGPGIRAQKAMQAARSKQR